MGKSKYTIEQKMWAINHVLNHEDSVSHTATILGIDNKALQLWIDRYQDKGIDGIKSSSQNQKYSSELKSAAVMDYLTDKGSLTDICRKYGLRSTSQLRKWIIKYNNQEELKASGTGETPIMTKGRKTTYEERIEIIEYCIEHENNYAETAEKYQVSYQQVYTWLKKYDSDGVEGLLDRRGRTKSESEMSELEKLRAENRLLKSENIRQEMEIAFLKKLDVIERRRF